MTEQELNSYRFTSGEEPTDEMLAAIMHEAAQDAAKQNRTATAAFFDELRRQADVIKARQAQTPSAHE